MVELTAREQQIIRLIFLGTYRVKDLAKKLVITYEAMRTEMCRLYGKYSVHSMIELVLMLQHEQLQGRIRTLPEALQCECGQRAVWRGWVIIQESTRVLLMCDQCRQDFPGKVEPALVILQAEQYAMLLDCAGASVNKLRRIP